MVEEKDMEWQVLLDKITSEAPASLVEEIHKSQDMRFQVKQCYSCPKIHEALGKWLSACMKKPANFKNTRVAVQYRQLGNNYCKDQQYARALKHYNKSLIYSLKDSDEQRSAYGNRSHVLLLMNQYEDSIKDIDRALVNDSSLLRQIKLCARKGECLVLLKKYTEATKILNETACRIHSLSPDLQKKAVKQLHQLGALLEIADHGEKRAKSDDKPSTEKSPKQEENKNCFPDLDFIKNPYFPGATNKVDMGISRTRGRCVVAQEDIEPGDILFVEKPFAFVVLPPLVHYYCSFCCKRTFTPVPCLECPLACFCDEECREAAMRDFHTWECGGLGVCFSVGIVHLALRVMLTGLLEENSNRYIVVEYLEAHLDKLQPSDLFSYTVSATLLTMYIEKYTTLCEGGGREERLMELGGLLLLHISQLVCNGHAITDIQYEELDPSKSLLIENQIRVGTAIYPSASMMNHSCEPNIINSFFNSILIVRANKDIRKDDEVFNCYGPMVHNTAYKKRQELLLSQYFFVCDCNACQLQKGPETDILVCKHCSSGLKIDRNTCDNCSKPIDMESLIKDLKESDSFFERGKAEKDDEMQYKYFLRALNLRAKHCHDSHRKVMESRDNLARAYAALGKEEEAYFLIVKNIIAIEGIFGKYSIELGQEIMKVITVISNLCDRPEKLSQKQRKILNECIEFGRKGLKIFTFSYGDWHPRFNEMNKHLDYIKLSLQLKK